MGGLLLKPQAAVYMCICGVSFTVKHMLSLLFFPRSVFPSFHQSEIRSFTTSLKGFTTSLLSEVCSDVHIESDLQEVATEEFPGKSTITTDGARLDITANGCCGGRFEHAFIDIRVFHYSVPSN